MNATGNRDKDSRKHCESSGWPQKDSAEHEKYAGAFTGSRITENNIRRLMNGLGEDCACVSGSSGIKSKPGMITWLSWDWPTQKRGGLPIQEKATGESPIALF